jgi:hypothetical protein
MISEFTECPIEIVDFHDLLDRHSGFGLRDRQQDVKWLMPWGRVGGGQGPAPLFAIDGARHGYCTSISAGASIRSRARIASSARAFACDV